MTMYPQTNAAAAALQPKTSALIDTRHDLGALVSELWNLKNEAQAIADSVFGVMPQPTVAGAVGRPAVSAERTIGKAEELRNGIAELRSVVEALRGEIERLACV